MKRPTQLPLAFSFSPALSRENFIVSSANAEALAFVESWPDWSVPIAALYGPMGCGKTHLASIWQERTGAALLSARQLEIAAVREQGPRVIEDVDAAEPTQERDCALFAAMQTSGPHAPLLLTGAAPPSHWACILPDLASRFSSLIALPVRIPDERVLAGLAQKLFADRQLLVPDDVIERILLALERSPAAVRAFVAEADAAALAEARPVNLSLVRRLLAAHRGVHDMFNRFR
jgi:chromosomal replication initiation ATPase DnaA